MRYWLDTEFDENGPNQTLRLISLGIVSEDGREFYAVSSDFDPEQCNDWVKKNVLTKLPPQDEWVTRAEMRSLLTAFFHGDVRPLFIGWYCDYDWVVFCSIFGSMIDLPPKYPQWCYDLRQLMHDLGPMAQNCKPPEPDQAHNALVDAHWTKELWMRLTQIAGRETP